MILSRRISFPLIINNSSLQASEQGCKRRRELPVPGIIPETEKAKESKKARNAIADAPRVYVFRNDSTDATDGCSTFRDKDIHEGKNPHGRCCTLPA